MITARLPDHTQHKGTPGRHQVRFRKNRSTTDDAILSRSENMPRQLASRKDSLWQCSSTLKSNRTNTGTKDYDTNFYSHESNFTIRHNKTRPQLPPTLGRKNPGVGIQPSHHHSPIHPMSGSATRGSPESLMFIIFISDIYASGPI